MKKAIIAVSAICLIVAVTVAYTFIFKQPMRLVVENESSEPVRDVLLSVGPHRFEMGEIRPGERKEKWFFYEGSDSSYHIEGMISKDVKLETDFGYVTHGMGFERIFMEFRNDGTIYHRDLKRDEG